MKILNALMNRKLNSQMTCTSYYDFLTSEQVLPDSLNCRNTRCNPPSQKDVKSHLGLVEHRLKHFDVDDNATEWYVGTRTLPIESRRMLCSTYRQSTGNELQRSYNAVTYSAQGRRVSPEFLNLLKQYNSRMPGLEQVPSQFRRLSFAYYKYDAEGKRRHMRPGIDTAAPLEFSIPTNNKYLEQFLRGQGIVTGQQASLKTEPKPSGYNSSSSKTKRKQKRVVQRTMDKGDQEKNRRARCRAHKEDNYPMENEDDPQCSCTCPLLPSPNCNNTCNQEQYWDAEDPADKDNSEDMEQKNRKEDKKNKNLKNDGLQIKMGTKNKSIAKLHRVFNSNLPVPLFCEPSMPISWCTQPNFTEKLAEYEKRLRRIAPACRYIGNKCTDFKRSIQCICDGNNNTNISSNCKQKVLDCSSGKDHLVIIDPHNSVRTCNNRHLRVDCLQELKKISCIRGSGIPPKKKVRRIWPCICKRCSEKNPKFHKGSETDPENTETDKSRMSESDKENGTQLCGRPSIGCRIPYEIKIPASCTRTSCTQTFYESCSTKEQSTQHFQIQSSSIGCNCPDEAKIRTSCTQTGFDLGYNDNQPPCLRTNKTTQTHCQRVNWNEKQVGTDDRCNKLTCEEPPQQHCKKPRLLPRLCAFTKRLLNSGHQLEKGTCQNRIVEIPIRCDGSRASDTKQRGSSKCDNQDRNQAQPRKNSCVPESCQHLKRKSSSVCKTISPCEKRLRRNAPACRYVGNKCTDFRRSIQCICDGNNNTNISSNCKQKVLDGSCKTRIVEIPIRCDGSRASDTKQRGSSKCHNQDRNQAQQRQNSCCPESCQYLKRKSCSVYKAISPYPTRHNPNSRNHFHTPERGSTNPGRNTINHTKTPQTYEQPCSATTCRRFQANKTEGHGHKGSTSPKVSPGRNRNINQTNVPQTDDKPYHCYFIDTGYKGSKYPERKRKKHTLTPQDCYMPSLGRCCNRRKKRTPKVVRIRAKKKSCLSDTNSDTSEMPASPHEEKCCRARRAQREKERKRAEEWRTERHNHCVTCRASDCCCRPPAYCNPCCPSIIQQRCNRCELMQYPSAYRCNCYQTCCAPNLSRNCTTCCDSQRMLGGEDLGGNDFIPGRKHSFATILPSNWTASRK